MWKDKHLSQHPARVVQTDITQCNINLASTELSQHCFINKSKQQSEFIQDQHFLPRSSSSFDPVPSSLELDLLSCPP